MFILFVVNIIVITSTCLFNCHINYFTFSHHFASDVSSGIIKYLFTIYSGNSKFIDPSIVGISGSINLLFPSYPVNKYKMHTNPMYGKEKHTSFVTYGYSFIVHKKTEDFLLDLKMLKW